MAPGRVSQTWRSPLVRTVQEAGLLEVLAADAAEFEATSARQPLTARLKDRSVQARLLFVAAVVAIQARLVARACGALAWPHAVAAVLAGAYVGDFISGIGHMVLDFIELAVVPAQERPLGQYLAFGFQYHHVRPSNWHFQDLLTVGILKTGLILFVHCCAVHVLARLAFQSAAFDLCWVVVSWHLLLCQVFHAAAHGAFKQTALAKVFAFLQRAGLCLGPQAHQLHHSNFDCNFCIVNGWANGLLNVLFTNVFAHLVSARMAPHVQRQVYFASGRIPFPYFEMFPALRAHGRSGNKSSVRKASASRRRLRVRGGSM